MMVRTDKPVTVTLGALTGRVQQLVASGRYASVSEVMRAGVRALDRDEAALEAWAKARTERTLSGGKQAVPLDEGFAEVRRKQEEKWAAGDA